MYYILRTSKFFFFFSRSTNYNNLCTRYNIYMYIHIYLCAPFITTTAHSKVSEYTNTCMRMREVLRGQSKNHFDTTRVKP